MFLPNKSKNTSGTQESTWSFYNTDPEKVFFGHPEVKTILKIVLCREISSVFRESSYSLDKHVFIVNQHVLSHKNITQCVQNEYQFLNENKSMR